MTAKRKMAAERALRTLLVDATFVGAQGDRSRQR